MVSMILHIILHESLSSFLALLPSSFSCRRFNVVFHPVVVGLQPLTGMLEDITPSMYRRLLETHTCLENGTL